MDVVRVDGPRGGVGRTYVRLSTGRVVPSVTTVVSLTPKPYLMNWVVKLAAEWAAAHVMDLYQMDYDERVTIIKAETQVLRNEGASKGTALHEYAEQYAWLGVIDPPSSRPEQAVIDIIDQLKPTILYTECMVWNETIGYAGTLDGVWQVEWQGKTENWLVDWKTSKSRSAEWVMQQDAYRRAETIINGRGAEFAMPRIDRICILWTPYDADWQVVEMTPTDADWVGFLAAREFFEWSQARTIREVFGETLLSGLSTDTTTRTEAEDD